MSVYLKAANLLELAATCHFVQKLICLSLRCNTSQQHVDLQVLQSK